MFERIHEAERQAENVITLNELLEGTDARFRKVVLGALIQEGFELGDSMPCLQHPMEILNAIDWLETFDFGRTWEAFLLALLEAAKTGILVDMRIPVSTTRQLAGIC
jgi:hypothetical protein